MLCKKCSLKFKELEYCEKCGELIKPINCEEKPYRCPVCGGNGLVPNGFYNQASWNWSTTSMKPEMCRSCNGSGIIQVKL